MEKWYQISNEAINSPERLNGLLINTMSRIFSCLVWSLVTSWLPEGPPATISHLLLGITDCSGSLFNNHHDLQHILHCIGAQPRLNVSCQKCEPSLVPVSHYLYLENWRLRGAEVASRSHKTGHSHQLMNLNWLFWDGPLQQTSTDNISLVGLNRKSLGWVLLLLLLYVSCYCLSLNRIYDIKKLASHE